MPFDYAANVEAVRANLAAHATSTANPILSQSLTANTIATIRVDDPDIVGVHTRELPAIFIRVQNSEEEPASLGPTGPLGTHVRKFKTVSYELVGLYHRDGMHTTHRDHLTELYQFAENVEGVFQREFTLSGTALWCHPERTDFGSFQTKEGVHIKGFVTTLRAKYLFR